MGAAGNLSSALRTWALKYCFRVLELKRAFGTNGRVDLSAKKFRAVALQGTECAIA